MTSILDFVQYKGHPADHKNLLFLGDGFSGNDRSLFKEAVERITEHLFTKVKPFDLVREKFNVFYFFSESPSPGISCVYPKLEKDSALGLEYKGGTRLLPRDDQESAIRDLIATLLLPGEPLILIPGCWQVPEDGAANPLPVGKDRGLVCVLVNDDVSGGTAFAPVSKEGRDDYDDWIYACAVSLGLRNYFNFITDSEGRVVDHVPISVGDSVRNHIPAITSVVAHELGHSHFGLADEYSERCLLMDWMLGPFPTQHPKWQSLCNRVRSRPNVATEQELDPPGDWASVKWNLPRGGNSDPAGLRIIDPKVLDYLGRPSEELRALWKSPLSPVHFRDSKPRCPPELAVLKLKADDRRQIIGAYEQGAREYLGVYTPAGICRMRSTHEADGEDGFREGTGGDEADFCYVCQYAIINQIDPGLLPDLAKKYPR